MAYSWPIWNDVTACKYNSNKSFGFRDTGYIKHYVGSSANNSHEFAETIITRRFRRITYRGKELDVVIFTMSVDNVVLKKSYFIDNKGRAGDHLFDKTKLKSIKSLK